MTVSKKLICFSFIIFGMTLAFAEPYPYTDPTNQGGWVLYEPMSDEFEGTSLDTDKWQIGMPYPVWDNQQPVTAYDPDAVTVSGGDMLCHAFQNPSHTYPDGYDVSGGHVISKDHRRFGYFEMRAKAINADVKSNFWLYSDGITWAREITLLEVAAGSPNGRFPQDYYHCGGHIWRTPTPTGVDGTHIEQITPYTLSFYPIDGYHIYGFEWDKNTMKWYIDGQLIHQMPTGDYTMGEMILCGTAYHVWQLPNGIDYSRFPATFNVDYLRTWMKPATNNTYYVDGATGSDSNSGLSWGQAKQTIRAAIDEAYDGDQIWVAEGTYTEYIVLYGIHGMKIYGGFDNGDTSLSQQDPSSNPTIIQAPPDGLMTFNIRGVKNVRLDGFTITGSDNRSGMKVFGPYEGTVIANCKITGNTPGSGGGGGVEVMPSYIGADPVVFEDCEFSYNTCGLTGGWGGGGGVNIDQGGDGSHPGPAHSKFYRCLFLDNQALQEGGAFSMRSGYAESTAKLVNCIMADNTNGSNKGAVHVDSGSIEVVNCTVDGSSSRGIAIENSSEMTSAVIKNSILTNNSSYGFYTNWSNISTYSIIDNNLFYNGTTNFYDGSLANSAYQINSRSYASANLVGNPQYVNAAAKDFHLTAGSPAIDNGTATGAPGDDYDRLVRPSGLGYDIGAYEYEGTIPTVPTAPSGLTATAISSSRIDLSWTDNSDDETHFDIERKIGSGGTWTYLDSVDANVTSYSDTGLSPVTTYYYRVSARNAAGNSDYSNESSATTVEADWASEITEIFSNFNGPGGDWVGLWYAWHYPDGSRNDNEYTQVNYNSGFRWGGHCDDLTYSSETWASIQYNPTPEALVYTWRAMKDGTYCYTIFSDNGDNQPTTWLKTLTEVDIAVQNSTQPVDLRLLVREYDGDWLLSSVAVDNVPAGQTNVFTIDIRDLTWTDVPSAVEAEMNELDQGPPYGGPGSAKGGPPATPDFAGLSGGGIMIDNLQTQESGGLELTSITWKGVSCGDPGVRELLADYTSDCYVNEDDFDVLVSAWITTYDLDDFETLALEWLDCTEPTDINCIY